MSPRRAAPAATRANANANANAKDKDKDKDKANADQATNDRNGPTAVVPPSARAKCSLSCSDRFIAFAGYRFAPRPAVYTSR